MARTVDSISQRETNTKESSQIERLIEAITRSQHVPAQATGTNASLSTSQQQTLQAQIETLTQKLNELTITVNKSDNWGGSRGGSGGSVEPPKLNVKTYNKRVVKKK